MELTSLCNAVDRRFLSDRLPNPYTEKDAEEWLKTVSENEAVTGIYRAIVYDRKLIGSISVEKKECLSAKHCFNKGATEEWLQV